MADFIKVADENELEEGDLYPILVDNEPICLTRIEGTVYAFADNCTHISGPLSQGEFENCTITCPWHGARFDVRTGKVMRGPARQDLVVYPVKIEAGNIYISFPEE